MAEVRLTDLQAHTLLALAVATGRRNDTVTTRDVTWCDMRSRRGTGERLKTLAGRGLVAGGRLATRHEGRAWLMTKRGRRIASMVADRETAWYAARGLLAQARPAYLRGIYEDGV